MVNIQISKISDDATIPNYAHEGDAGVDLFTVQNHTIKPGERQLVPTGIKVAIPMGYEAQVRPKSGLAIKHGLSVVNSPGTIDAGYRGEIGIIAINHGQEDIVLEKGNKVAQMVFAKVEHVTFEEVSELDETKRGEGGFGSTGQ